jgi:iron complex transport system permease protein
MPGLNGLTNRSILPWCMLIAGSLLLPVLVIAGLRSGPTAIPMATIAKSLVAFDGSPDQLIVRTIRFPRICMGILVGAGLSVAGAAVQGFTRNPLASPDILGISSGAALGWAIARVLLHCYRQMELALAAMAGAAIAIVVIYVFSIFLEQGAGSLNLVVGGAALNAVLTSSTTILLISTNHLNYLDLWPAGSLAGVNQQLLLSLAPLLLIGMLAAQSLSRDLNLLGLGEETAISLGVHTGRCKFGLAVSVLLLAGVSVAAAGPIGFVGLMVPHIARALIGQDYRWILPCSGLLGALFLALSDLASRVIISPNELPAGIVTAALGAVFFLLLVRRQMRTADR